MLVKLSELLYKLYSDDWQNIIEALRVIRVLDAVTVEQISETILSGKATERPVFHNPTAKPHTLTADDTQLKLLATHIKQKTDLLNNLKLVSKINDAQLDRLAQLIKNEPEAIIVVERNQKLNGNAKPFLPLVNWGQQKDLASGR
jgi:hypothetical protein